jgi:hypothetical protein
VRGTAKNPNDHPHGGRTRAIRYPLTPWGRTAKKSRAPRQTPRLKALRKRDRTLRVIPAPFWAPGVSAEEALPPVLDVAEDTAA